MARERPRRIDQVIPSIVARDAVSHHTLEAQRVLRSLGFVSEIYAAMMGPEMLGAAHPIGELGREAPGRQWLVYQGSTGSPAAEVFAEHPARKLVDYHNITPDSFLEDWVPELAAEVRLGRKQLAELAESVDFAMADSAYNKEELDEWGYKRSVVSMLMVDRSNFDVPPDRRLLARLAKEKDGGRTDWLFVGQYLPHKCQHDVVAAFAAYREAFDPSARLHLVGRASSPGYAEAVRRLAHELGLEGAVDFARSVSPNELAALYISSDVYVCCSEHEGFCAPLLESMHHRLPVVAYRAAAVPETLGGAGVLLDSKEPAVVAAAAAKVCRDGNLRADLEAAGTERLTTFSPSRARGDFASAIGQALELG